jgi:uncharacterized tellurite resistance protein B-like protein
MDRSRVEAETVDLISKITDKDLALKDLSPPVIFLASLVTVLLGVIYADLQVKDEEKLRLNEILDRFIPRESDVRRLTHLMIKGIKQREIYTDSAQWQVLISPLSDVERLLLIGLGYEMSAADGHIEIHEQEYLDQVANFLKIESRYLHVLAMSFGDRGNVDQTALDEVRNLLDPARFHQLEPVFVSAASQLLNALPSQPDTSSTLPEVLPSQTEDRPRQTSQTQPKTAYTKLQQFQQHQQTWQGICSQLNRLLNEGIEQNLLPTTLASQLDEISQRLRSQQFRIAIAGEFNHGKSTLINALVGKEIQPVRVIACSGTITVLRHGLREKVICRYLDGREEEIPVEQYQEKASISSDAAQENCIDELLNSDLEEIIFEHPSLDLCRNGVEIVDSPGLNEHPARTAITQQLIDRADAIVFLIHALKPLTQGERELIRDIQAQASGDRDKPMNNLFLIVNFSDLLSKDKDRQDIQQLVINFAQGKSPILTGKNRIHLISAQSALDDILKGVESNFLDEFRNFTQSLEEFLVDECAYIKISPLKKFIQSCLHDLEETKKFLEGEPHLSPDERQQILEHIGEACGRDFTTQKMANELREKAIEQTIKAWERWQPKLIESVKESSSKWHSEHSPLFSQKSLIVDYINQLILELGNQIYQWLNTRLRDTILAPKVVELEKYIGKEFATLEQKKSIFDALVKNVLSNSQQDFKVSGIDANFMGIGGAMGGIGAGAGFGAGLFFLINPLTLIPAILIALAAALAGGFGLGGFDIDLQIRRKVCEVGLDKFSNSKDSIHQSLRKIITALFIFCIEETSRDTKEVISSYENILVQNDQSAAQRQASKEWCQQKCQELEQMQIDIDAVLEQ